MQFSIDFFPFTNERRKLTTPNALAQRHTLIDRTASENELSYNNLNKTLRFHKSIRVNVRVSEVF